MTTPACPECTLTDVLSHPDHWECSTCGHEWPKEAAPETARVVKDAHGNVLVEGDTVALIKDLKLGSGSQVLNRAPRPRTSACRTATTKSPAKSTAPRSR